MLFLKRVSCEVQRPWSGARSPLTLAHCSHQPCVQCIFYHIYFLLISSFFPWTLAHCHHCQISFFAHFLFSSDLGTVPQPTMCTASLFCHISFFDPFSLSLSSVLGKLPTACIIALFFSLFLFLAHLHNENQRHTSSFPAIFSFASWFLSS